ncbi:MFS transporter [Paenibacillus sp. JJ-223]|uniref:MFS transporter n=1 Tax=Paenibacillus sp. JJ-223 TaxID=2905647 RepID=UPI001F287FDE|nr:MFS transporter [Paenibacillus sp. JJ-223]CAH1197232.1 Enterobactin exporter EntS [Paenibacillus sp. JJ-223]
MSKKVNDTSYRELLMHREYLFVLVSSTLSSFGFVLFQVVLFWLAYKMSETTFQAAVVVQSSAVPYLLFGLLGGVYADHWNKKKIIIWNQLGTGFMIFTILIMYWLHIESIWYIAVASFFIVSLRCFYSPAIRSLVSKTLPEALWPKGNSIFQLSLQLSRSIAPIFSGILLSHFSSEWMFFIFFILTIAPIGFVIPLFLEHKKTSKSVRVIKEVKETFTFLKTKNSLFISIVSFGIVLLFFTGMERLGLPIISDQQWQKGAKGFSIMLTLFGIGNALGAVLLEKIEIKSHYSRFIMINCILWGLGLMGVGLSPNLYLACLFALFTGITEAFIDLPMVLMIQKFTPEDKIGKVFSFLSTIAFIGEAGSSILVAFVMGVSGTHASFIIIACSIIVICCTSLFLMERRKIDNRISTKDYRLGESHE